MKLIDLGKATAETKTVITAGPIFDNVYQTVKRM